MHRWRNPASAALALFLTILTGLAEQVYPESGEQDETGFVTIFDGESLTGWEGDPRYWRVEKGCLVGEVKPENLLERNTFIIWQGGRPGDFELKLEYQITAEGNSGINYRSEPVANFPHALQGYQADIDGGNQYTGQNYEERGRTFLALRGDLSRVGRDGKSLVIGSVGEKARLAASINKDDWNAVHLIVRGNTMIHLVNGRVMSVLVDDDDTRRRFEGLIGVQVHVGPPMTVRFRNLRLKKLSDDR